MTRRAIPTLPVVMTPVFRRRWADGAVAADAQKAD
ncbi:hypothetical protein AZOA_09210 [Azoarcus sp. Aa7]|nr:hypothetical protein [Azoarcus sp. Aa7]